MTPFKPGRALAIARKEWTQLRRDPRSMALAFALPLLLLIFFGYAISLDVDDVRLAVLDQDRSALSRELLSEMTASGAFQIVTWADDPASGTAALLDGSAIAYLEIPPGFSTNVLSGRPAPLQLILDGSDANSATIAEAYANGVVRSFAAGLPSTSAAPPVLVRVENRVWYNPTLESRHMIVPALIAVIMSIIAAMLTSLTIAREWERGTMEQLASTPVSELELVLGKLAPYVLIGMIDVAVTIVAGMLLFGTPFQGNPFLLAGLTLLFLVGALSVGMIISATVRSQVLAVQLAMVATQLPAVLLSGFIFDIAAMPGFLQAVTFVIPARYFVTVTRGIFLKGVGVEVLWIQGALMIAFAVVGLTLATRVFHKRIMA